MDWVKVSNELRTLDYEKEMPKELDKNQLNEENYGN